MASRKRYRIPASRSIKIIYTVLGIFSVGYFPAYWLLRSGGPQISMVALGLLAIPYGSKACSVGRGLLVGLAIGFWGGLATVYAIVHSSATKTGEMVISDRLVAVSVAGTTILCGAIACLFAYLAKRRTDRMNEQWS